MATLIESLKPIAPNTLQTEIPLAYKIRLIAPFLYAAVGISLGTLTGLGIAIWTAPNSSGGTMIDSASAASSPTPIQQPQAIVMLPEQQSQPVKAGLTSDAGPVAMMAVPAARQAASIEPAILHPVDLKEVRALHSLSATLTVQHRGARKRLALFRRHRRTATSHRLRPALSLTTVLASSTGFPDEANPSHPIDMDEVAAPVTFYMEGDLTVVDYNAKTGTIETSDGRTFLVGSTVSSSDAVSWSDYHSDVHYRCSQTGSCTLSRAGVIAPNARMI